MLLRNINEEQLISGRLGLLLDVPNMSEGPVTPYIAMYQAESIINWDDGARDELVVQNLNLVSLNETEYERKEEFEWEMVEKYRILTLGDPETNQPVLGGQYMVGVFRDDGGSFSYDPALAISPSIAGQTIDFIPFTFINAADVVPSPDIPPLQGLARLALTIYRGEADYRQALFMQSQDTLVVVGSTDEEAGFRTGANASIILPMGGDAKFIGVNSNGLPEMRQALQNDKAMAMSRGGQLMDTVSRERESGDALRVRVAARTATLNQIALAGAFGLEQSLKQAAVWVGADPNEVSVTPNLDFSDQRMDARSLVELMTAKGMGLPLSTESIHAMLRDHEMTEMEFADEIAKLEEESELLPAFDDNRSPMEDEPNELPSEADGNTGRVEGDN